MLSNSTYDLFFRFSVELQAIANITSWVEQGTLEISTLIERFSDKERVFLLGDVNVGPAAPSLGIVPVQPGNKPLYTLAVLQLGSVARAGAWPLQHYANTPMQYTAIFHGYENVKF